MRGILVEFDVIKEEEAPAFMVYHRGEWPNKEELHDMYWNNNMSLQQIADDLGCSQGFIMNLMKEYNIPRRSLSEANRKYRVNEDFFKNWSHNMAYVLGEGVCADGDIYIGDYVNRFKFSSNDKELLEDIRGVMQSEHPIKLKKGTRNYCIQIGSVKIVQYLLNLGITPNKSLTLEFPDVPEEYLPSFIRGEFDGDGCVYLQKGYNGIRVSICSGSDNFTLKLNSLLHENDINSHLWRFDGELCGIYISKKSEVKKFYDFIYSTPGPYLKRKKDIFDKFFGVINID